MANLDNNIYNLSYSVNQMVIWERNIEGFINGENEFERECKKYGLVSDGSGVTLSNYASDEDGIKELLLIAN